MDSCASDMPETSHSGDPGHARIALISLRPTSDDVFGPWASHSPRVQYSRRLRGYVCQLSLGSFPRILSRILGHLERARHLKPDSVTVARVDELEIDSCGGSLPYDSLNVN